MPEPEITAYIITTVVWNLYIIVFTSIYVYYRKHPFIRQRIYPLTLVATAGIWLIGNFVTILKLYYWSSHFPYPCGIFTAIQVIGGIMPIYVLVLRAVFLLHNFLIQKIISGVFFEIQPYEIVVLTMFSDKRKMRSVIDSSKKKSTQQSLSKMGGMGTSPDANEGGSKLEKGVASGNDVGDQGSKLEKVVITGQESQKVVSVGQDKSKPQEVSFVQNETNSKPKINFPGDDNGIVQSMSGSGLAATKSAAGSSTGYKPLGAAWEELSGVDIRATPPARVFLKWVGYFFLFQLLIIAAVYAGWSGYITGNTCLPIQNLIRIIVQCTLVASIPFILYLIRNVEDLIYLRFEIVLCLVNTSLFFALYVAGYYSPAGSAIQTSLGTTIWSSILYTLDHLITVVAPSIHVLYLEYQSSRNIAKGGVEEMLEVLVVPRLAAQFQKVLEKQFCAENFLFYQDYQELVARYKQDGNKSSAAFRKALHRVEATFLESGGTLELNIPSKVMKQYEDLKRASPELSPYTLDPIKDEVVKMMFTNSFPLFVKEKNAV